MTEQENQIFVSALKRIIREANLDGVKRKAFLTRIIIALGDEWYQLCRLHAWEQSFGEHLVFVGYNTVVERNKKLASFLSYGGYRLEVFDSRSDTDFALYKIYREKVPIPPDLAPYFVTMEEGFNDHYFMNWGDGPAFGFQFGVRAPVFPPFDKAAYMERFGVIPQKTFWIIPQSNFLKPLPREYWNTYAQMLRNLGFAVVFNAAENDGFDGPSFLCPLEDSVAFAELCGNVLGLRTGFLDFIATAKAQFTVFSPPLFMNLERAFCIDNSDNHIRYIPIQTIDMYSDPAREIKSYAADLPELTYIPERRPNFVEFLYRLAINSKNRLVILSIRGSICPSPQGRSELSALQSFFGLGFDFAAGFGSSYIGIISDGEVADERYHPTDPIGILFESAGHRFEVISVGRGAGGYPPQIKIEVDSVNAAQNGYGLNVVVFDTAAGQVADSVCLRLESGAD